MAKAVLFPLALAGVLKKNMPAAEFYLTRASICLTWFGIFPVYKRGVNFLLVAEHDFAELDLRRYWEPGGERWLK